MGLLFVTESLIYFICLIVVTVKVLEGNFKKYLILFCSLLHFILLVMSLKTECDSFAVYYVVALIIEIALFWFSAIGISLKSLVGTFLLLFSLNIILTSSIISFFPRPSNIYPFIELIVHLLMLVMCIVICYSKLLYKIKSILSWTPRRIKNLVIVLMFFSAIITTLIFDIQYHSKSEEWIFAIHRILVLLILFICAIICLLVLNTISNTNLKILTANYEEQIKAQAEHYDALSKANFELRRFRHDLKNIQIGVSELIEKGKYDEAVDMLKISKYDIYNTTNNLLCFDTGNGIVDALLADKQRKAESSNVKIIFGGAIPQNVLTPTELCVLFGNTVDNAIEACEKSPDNENKIININCKCSSGFMFLNITNPVNEVVRIHNNSVVTTKTDKTLHGFGLYSLDRIVKKYSGELKLSCDNNKFEVDISMAI